MSEVYSQSENFNILTKSYAEAKSEEREAKSALYQCVLLLRSWKKYGVYRYKRGV